jgi:hypothetical protein
MVEFKPTTLLTASLLSLYNQLPYRKLLYKLGINWTMKLRGAYSEFILPLPWCLLPLLLPRYQSLKSTATY